MFLDDYILYSLIDRRFWIYQPTYVRRRHRFRGPRESFKINQEISMLYTDLKKLSLALNEIDEALEDRTDVMLNGHTYEDITYDWMGDLFGPDQTLEISGLYNMASELDAIRTRIMKLERLSD